MMINIHVDFDSSYCLLNVWIQINMMGVIKCLNLNTMMLRITLPFYHVKISKLVCKMILLSYLQMVGGNEQIILIKIGFVYIFLS